MGITLSTNNQINVRPIEQSTNPLGNYSGSPQITYALNLSTSQLNYNYSTTFTLTGTTQTFNVLTGLTGQYGQNITMSILKTICIINNSDTAVLTIGGGTDPVIGSDQFTIGPGQCLYTDNPYTVTSSVENLLVTSTVSGSSFDIILLGY